MMKRLKSLRLQILLPVLVMTLFIVIMLSMLFSRAYTSMILQQEQAVNATGFETISHTVPSSITTAIGSVRDVITDSRVIACIRRQFASDAEMFNAKAACVDYLREKIAHADWANGLFIMRKDGSLFGTLPDGNYFHDEPKDNPLPEEMKERILDVPLGQTVWVGPVSGADMYGFENKNTPRGYLIAAWKAVDVRFSECRVLMLIDLAAFDRLFSALEDGKSTWRIFTADREELYHTGSDPCGDAERLIENSNSGTVFSDESGRSVSAFAMAMPSPQWTLVREVSMEESEQVIRQARKRVGLLAGIIFLIALAAYVLWLKRFSQQYRKLVSGITRMGKELEPLAGVSFFATEFETIKEEIDRTSLALNEQMDTIRRMERDKAELESKRKEQELIARELSTARQIQESMLPHVFPPFPDRKEVNLFASMDPARDVGGDFYDFFFIDEDHLCLVIADVSGKGIPGAMFMMFSKRIIEDSARQVHSPAEILTRTNEALCDNNQAEMFVTVWLGILEISTGKLTAANAGHEFPAIRRNGSCFELYRDKHGFVLGGLKEARYKEYELQIAPGDKLFVYTDGVPEATAAIGEMFGTDRMIFALNTCADGSPEAILSSVRSAVDAFVGEAEQFDDLTMLCLEYCGTYVESVQQKANV